MCFGCVSVKITKGPCSHHLSHKGSMANRKFIKQGGRTPPSETNPGRLHSFIHVKARNSTMDRVRSIKDASNYQVYSLSHRIFFYRQAVEYTHGVVSLYTELLYSFGFRITFGINFPVRNRKPKDTQSCQSNANP
jgi:hypothetical protein